MNSGLKIYGCNIVNHDVGLSLGSTVPFATMGYQIGSISETPNNLVNNVFGITSSGNVDALPILIENNNFYSNIGTGMSGNNHFLVKNNAFVQYENGLVLFMTGSEYNRISCNTYAGPNIGIFTLNSSNLFFGDNSRTDFVNNEFSGAAANLLLFGEIAPNIGMPTESANNCFMDGDIISVNSPSFDYYYKEHGDDLIECRQEPLPSPNINIDEADDVRDYCDGNVGVFNNIIGDPNDTIYARYKEPPGDPVICWECIKDTIITLVEVVTEIGGDDPTTYFVEGDPDVVKSPKVQSAGKDLDNWIHYAIFKAKQYDTLSFAEEILQPLHKWDWQAKLFGIKILKGDLLQASSFLSEMQALTTKEANFVQIQKIQLKYLGGYYNDVSISKGEIDTLRSIALSETVMSGYARSLYFYLEEERLPFILPDTTILRSKKISLEKSNFESPYSIYPNPASDILTISCQIDNGYCEGIISIFDISGRLLITKDLSLDENTEIDITNLNSGVYLARIISEKGQIHSEKIIKH